jgi:hypothetical protein
MVLFWSVEIGRPLRTRADSRVARDLLSGGTSSQKANQCHRITQRWNELFNASYDDVDTR